MSEQEPIPTAIALGAFGALLLVSALLSRASRRIGVPVALVFLVVGIAAGSEGIGRIAFEDYRLAFQIGTGALVLILFDGGLNTQMAAVKEAIRPAGVLATAGVVLTAAFATVGGRLFGLGWHEALLLGAIVSSTDAAAVFAVLRSGGVQLKRRVGTTLEIESGLNDPMAVILTTALTASIMQGTSPTEPRAWLLLVGQVLVQLAVGTLVGVGVGYAGRAVLSKAKLSAGGLYPVMTTALAGLAFSAATLLWGSGFLAVYVAGVVLGNGYLPYRAGVQRVHDAIAWFAQVGMFLLLGLLVFPSRLIDVALIALLLGLFLAFVARPLAVVLCLLPFRFPLKELAFLSWAGLRGAVPIILATIPLMAGVSGASRIFDVVFFIVVVNSILPGSTIRFVTDRLGLRSDAPPPPSAVLDVTSMKQLRGSIIPFFVDKASAVANVKLSDIPLPESASIMVIVRGDELVPPRGHVVLSPGDHIYVLVRPDDEAMVSLMFGQREQMQG